MASGSFKQPKQILVSSAKVKPRSIDKETQKPSKRANSVIKTKKGWASSSDGAVKL